MENTRVLTDDEYETLVNVGDRHEIVAATEALVLERIRLANNCECGCHSIGSMTRLCRLCGDLHTTIDATKGERYDCPIHGEGDGR